jgi:hypothetical protein
MRLLAPLSEYLFVLPLVTIRYLLTEFVLNMILRSLTNICRHIQILVTTDTSHVHQHYSREHLEGKSLSIYWREFFEHNL